MTSLLDFALTVALSLLLQDPNADTEWNDILRKKGILPPKESLTELEKEAAEKEEQALLQQSVGELALFLPLFCVFWLWKQATNCYNCYNKRTFWTKARAGALASALPVVAR